MEKYIPKIGDTVRADCLFKVLDIKADKEFETVIGEVQIGAIFYAVKVPLACVEPWHTFNPNLDAAWNDAYQEEGRNEHD
jgi:hypothetical protein